MKRGEQMDNTNNHHTGAPPMGWAHKFLRIFTVVQPGEAVTALLLTFNVFLLLVAYYIIKPVREGLILAGKGAEWKSYLSAVIAVLLVFVVKAFSRVASRVPRQKLISWVTLFFISNLVIFYFLSFSGIPEGDIGVIFYVWMGIFNVMVIAQFWAFTNDLYTEGAGKRLFPIVAFGATFGGFVGSTVAEKLIGKEGPYYLMLVSGVILGFCIILTWIIHRREIKKPEVVPAGPQAAPSPPREEKEKPLEKGGGFQLLFKKRYLLLLAIFVLVLNFINTNGEYILGHVVEEAAAQAAEIGVVVDEEVFIGEFYAGFMKYFNLFAMVIQLFIVSRLFKWIGVRGALFFLPVLALGGYFLVAVGASLLLVKWVKIAENGTDYSLMNTTRHALFLITSRKEKYKAKAAIDTFFHRAGDVLSALVVFAGTTYLSFKTENFAAFNVVLIFIWIIVGVFIFKEHLRLNKDTGTS